MQQLHGLFTCDECGALCDENGASKHLEWHKLTNEAFGGTMVLFKLIEERLDRLESRHNE